MKNNVKFTVFADFHYKKGMYAPSVENLQEILDRANDDGAEFILHLGDFCNYYKGSPELVELLMNNPYGLRFYGTFGNHELEADPMDYVLTKITNDNTGAVFGSDDGKPNADAAYYYHDEGKFRFISLDTNYSYNEERDEWQRNTALARPKENIRGDSIGPRQLSWLEDVLASCADADMKAIIFAHAGFSGVWSSSPDHAAVRNIIARTNEKKAGTVILVMNGHYHTNHLQMIDGVLYFDVNTAINGHWQSQPIEHYFDEHTYLFTDYDELGNKKGSYKRPYSELTMAKKTWFFRDPLSATVTVNADGEIRIEGRESSWVYGITPPEGISQATIPMIESGVFKTGKL